jgi:hypothetical protein
VALGENKKGYGWKRVAGLKYSDKQRFLKENHND